MNMSCGSVIKMMDSIWEASGQYFFNAPENSYFHIVSQTDMIDVKKDQLLFSQHFVVFVFLKVLLLH